MSAYESLALLGLIVGPVSAVIITLWYQARTAKRERQALTFRTLIGTRHLAADPNYSIAINMVPIDFSGNQKIKSAWGRYMDAVYYRSSQEDFLRHQQEMKTRQTELIFEIAKYLKYEISESDLEKRSYAAQSFVDRDGLSIQAQVAWIRIANALEAQNSAAGLPGPPSPDELIPEQNTGESE